MQGLRGIWLAGLALFLDPFCKERGLIMHDIVQILGPALVSVLSHAVAVPVATNIR